MLDARAQRVARQQRHIGFDAIRTQEGGQRVAFFDCAGARPHLGAVAQLVFAAFAGVGLAANAVHGHGQHRMRFGGDRTQRHGAGGKALDDFLGRFHFAQRDGARGIDLELEQAAQRHVPARLVVDQLGIFFISAVVVGARGVLQLGD